MAQKDDGHVDSSQTLVPTNTSYSNRSHWPSHLSFAVKYVNNLILFSDELCCPQERTGRNSSPLLRHTSPSQCMKLVQTIEAELNDQSVCWNDCVWVVAGFGLGGSCLYGALFLLEAHKQLKIVAYECDPSTFEGASGILRKLEEQFPHIRGRIELKQENVAVLLLKDRPGWVADVENKKGRVILTAYNQAYGDSVVILAAVASVYKAIFVGSTNDKVQHFTGKTMVDGKMSKFGTKQWFVFHEKKFSAEKALSLLEKMQKDKVEAARIYKVD